MTTRSCIFCDNGIMIVEPYCDHIVVDGITILVEGLVHFECTECQSVLTTAEQYERNFSKLRSYVAHNNNLAS